MISWVDIPKMRGWELGVTTEFVLNRV